MYISVNWLKDWVDFKETKNKKIDNKKSVDDLAARLTMAGLEVDSVTPAPEFTGVMIGQITALEKHPNADKLRICTINIGAKKQLIIVCGAANARKDLKVAVAQLGAILPKMEIKPVAIRDVDSAGMLCSEAELGMAESADGIIELPEDAPIGTDVRKYFDLDDTIIEVDMTPNRGDCLGMKGVAREVGVMDRRTVKPVKFKSPTVKHEQTFTIEVKAPEACPRYLGRVLTGLDANAITPMWMIERLRRCGIRSLGPLVDVTNYVLLEFGQPMHAFDLKTLEGKITVRMAQAKEKLTLLDGKEVELDDDVLLICDDKRPLALAGIMGGEGSGISDSTTDVFLECAFFTPTAITGRARRYGLQTDSSYRFERGVDSEVQAEAMDRASQLLLDICGGEAGEVTEACSKKHLPKPAKIKLRHARVEKLLGMSIDAKEMSDILKRLGMQLTQSKTKKTEWQVTAPSWRFDIAIEADLVEEIGRIVGYDNIPVRKPTGALTASPRSEQLLDNNRFKNLLVDRGFQEVITYSFVEPAAQQQIMPDLKAVELANPISSEMSVMRTSLWTGLLQAVRHNLNRQQSRVRIFETGLSFVLGNKGMSDIVQNNKLAGAVCGAARPEQWGESVQAVDFFDLKADIEALIELTGDNASFEFVADSNPALHPGQSACIKRNGDVIGWMGKLHPELVKKQDLAKDVFLFELDLGSLEAAIVPAFAPLSKYPSIRRDLSIVVDEEITSQQIRETIKQAVPDQLSEVHVFDVYRGKGVDFGRKSLALGLILQETSRTLIDKEVDAAIEWVVVRLQKELGASLRE